MKQNIEELIGPRSIRRHGGPPLRFMTVYIVGALGLLTASSAMAATARSDKVLTGCVLVSALTASTSTVAWVLDLNGISYDEGARFQLWSYNAGANQKFVLSWGGPALIGGTTWTMGVGHSGKCMYTLADKNLQPVQQYTCTTAMPWILSSLSNGNYIVRSGFDRNYVLDVNNSSLKNGAAVTLYKYNGGLNQQWKISLCRNMKNEGFNPAG